MAPPPTVVCALVPSALLTPRAKASSEAYLPRPRLPVNTRVQRRNGGNSPIAYWLPSG